MDKSTVFWRTVLLFVDRTAIGIVILFAIYFVLDLVHTRRTETTYMKRYVISPLPPSLVRVKTLELSSPLFSNGDCQVAYEMTSQAFDQIMHNGRKLWDSGLLFSIDAAEPGAQEKKLFRGVWPEITGELETYSSGGDSEDGIPGSVEMIASPDHTKALFIISDL